MIADYIITPYSYAKNSVVVKPTKDGSGLKARADYLVEAMKGRYVGRAKGYVLPKSKVAKFEKLYAEGWSGGLFGDLRPPA